MLNQSITAEENNGENQLESENGRLHSTAVAYGTYGAFQTVQICV